MRKNKEIHCLADKQARLIQLDIFKLLLIISVIIIHSNTYLHLKFDKSVPFIYFIQLAVPMFMILSGYTFSLAYARTKSLKVYYEPKRIIIKIIRFSFPMVLTTIVYLVARIVSQNTEDMIIPAITFNFGPGSYYFMLVIELILIFPLVYSIVDAMGGYGVIICIAISLGSEVLCRLVNLSAYWYSRNIFEYFVYIGFGCWIFHLRNSKKKPSIFVIIVSAFIGVAWITLTQYGIFKESLFKRNLAYGLPVAFYVWLIIFVLSGINIHKKNIIVGILAELGCASFHILCVQMIWFTSLNTIRGKIPFVIPSLYFMPIGILVCVLMGYVFYRVDNAIQKWMFALRR